MTELAPARALAIAILAHRGQADKNGQPILSHVLRVAGAVAHLGDEAITVALLHDVVEDSETTVDDIYEAFGPEVALQVELLTHKPGVGYADYISRIAQRGGIALAVKLQDNADNACEQRLQKLPPRIADQLRGRYAMAKQILLTGTAP